MGIAYSFHQDFSAAVEGNVTHIISGPFPRHMKHTLNRAQRLLAESQFYRKNLNEFLALKKRAKQVLKLVAIGKSSAEISEELCISGDTVNTNRKTIEQKLEI